MKSLLILITLLQLTSCSIGQHENSRRISSVEGTDNLSEDSFKKNNYEFKLSDDYLIDSKDNLIGDESIHRLDTNSVENIGNVEKLGMSGLVQCLKGNFQESEKIFDQQFRDFQNNPAYWNQIGSCYYHQSDYKKAQYFFTKSISISKEYPPALNNLGVMALKKNKFKTALAYFDRALHSDKDSKTPKFNLVHLYLKYANPDLAYQYILELKKASAADLDLLNAEANYYLQKNQLSKAISIFEDIPISKLKRADLAVNYAVALKLNNNTPKAKEVLAQVDVQNLGSLEKYFYEVSKYLEAP